MLLPKLEKAKLAMSDRRRSFGGCLRLIRLSEGTPDAIQATRRVMPSPPYQMSVNATMRPSDHWCVHGIWSTTRWTEMMRRTNVSNEVELSSRSCLFAADTRADFLATCSMPQTEERRPQNGGRMNSRSHILLRPAATELTDLAMHSLPQTLSIPKQCSNAVPAAQIPQPRPSTPGLRHAPSQPPQSNASI